MPGGGGVGRETSTRIRCLMWARFGSEETGDGLGGYSGGEGLWHRRATVSTIGIDKSTGHVVRVHRGMTSVLTDLRRSTFVVSKEC